MRNTYLLISLLIVLSRMVLAQAPGRLTGLLKDPAGSPISYGTVAVIPAAGKNPVAGGVSEPDGRFSVAAPSAAGSYFLRVTAVGYQAYESPAFTVTAGFGGKEFGTIIVQSDTKLLKEVTVQAMQPTITQEADRLVVNVEGSALTAGNTAYQVLARIPGVFIDAEGNIQLNGRSGVTIMLNGKLTYLSARDQRTMLEGMSGENIKNVEVITNPSAKYDAEGSSGILNINLKRNELRGMNGSFYSGYNFNGKQHGYSAGGTFNHKSGPWSSFAMTDFARRVGGREATFTRVFYGAQQTTYFDQVATGNFQAVGPPSVRLGTDYALNARHSLGVMAYVATNYAVSDFLTNTYIGNRPNQPTLYIDADNFNNNRFTNYTGNVHYLGKLDTAGTTLSADLDYIRITNHSTADFFNYYDTLASSRPVTRDFLYTDIPSGYDIYSAKVDYSRVLPNGQKLELGAKSSRVISDNDARFYFNNGEVPILDPRRTNHFYYRENINAAYANWSGKLGTRYKIQAGLRAEQTLSRGEQLTTGEVFKRRYLNLFPSLFVQQTVSPNHQINYSYSRRIQRPNYGNLNPFMFYRDPYTWFQGNPYMRPQFTLAFSVTQTFKKTYSLAVNYQLHRDAMAELPMLDVERAYTIYYVGNVNNAYSAGITGIAPVRLRKGWESSNTVVLSYSYFQMQVNQEPIVNEQLFFMAQSNQSIQLPLDLRLEVNLGYRGPSAYGLYRIASQSWVNLGLKKSFLGKKLDLSLNANDIFRGQRLLFTTNIGRNINDFNQYFRNRTIGLTLRYNFSKGLKVDTRRNNSLEELNRTGN